MPGARPTASRSSLDDVEFRNLLKARNRPRRTARHDQPGRPFLPDCRVEWEQPAYHGAGEGSLHQSRHRPRIPSFSRFIQIAETGRTDGDGHRPRCQHRIPKIVAIKTQRNRWERRSHHRETSSGPQSRTTPVTPHRRRTRIGSGRCGLLRDERRFERLHGTDFWRRRCDPSGCCHSGRCHSDRCHPKADENDASDLENYRIGISSVP